MLPSGHQPSISSPLDSNTRKQWKGKYISRCHCSWSSEKRKQGMWEQTEGKGSHGINSQSQYEKGHGKAQIPDQSYVRSALLCKWCSLVWPQCSSLTNAHQAREMVQCSRVGCSCRGPEFNSRQPYQEAHNRLLFQVQKMQHSLPVFFRHRIWMHTHIHRHTHTETHRIV